MKIVFHELSITEKERQVIHDALIHWGDTLYTTPHHGSTALRRTLDNDRGIAGVLAKKLNNLGRV